MFSSLEQLHSYRRFSRVVNNSFFFVFSAIDRHSFFIAIFPCECVSQAICSVTVGISSQFDGCVTIGVVVVIVFLFFLLNLHMNILLFV